MRRLWLRILFAASLCLNAGFLAALGVQALQHRRGHDMSELHLTPQAKAQVDANFKTFREKLGPLNADLRAERLKMLSVLASENPSPEAVAAQQAKVVAATERMLQLTDDHLLVQKKLLNLEQQRLFFDHIRRRIQDTDRRSPFP
jgi:Spy/CpxP family protein refolding chaperone